MKILGLLTLALQFLNGLLAYIKRAEEANKIEQKEIVDEKNKSEIHEAFKNEDAEALNNVFSGDKPSKLRDSDP